MMYKNDQNFAREMDKTDPLSACRDQFHIPKTIEGDDCLYFCGNSLGLQPKALKEAMAQELTDWQNLGVEGHFQAKNPWLPYHEFLADHLAKLVGAKSSEVVAMNTLTVNLHLMMVSFYRPTERRFKILIEGHAFPSDQYAVQSQVKFHGFDPKDAIIELHPREGERTIRTEDIEAVIEKEGESIALIMLGGVQYYTGQLFDMERITKVGHAKGALVGFDLAHAAGNVPLRLHEWDVDFAVWCSYKYINSGPGSIAGCFVHERHGQNPDLPRFCGWWGQNKDIRFKMGPDFDVLEGAEGWQLSNPPILSLVAVKTSLEIFSKVGMDALREKSLKLTGYLEFLLNDLETDQFEIMTPQNPDERGCQISILVHENGRKVFEGLEKAHVICDWREPDCIRVAPVPLYNSFADIYNFVEIFARQLGAQEKMEKTA